MISELPLKPLKRILKNYYNSEISENVFECFRNVLLNISCELAEAAVKEFNAYNENRMLQGLPRVKRLNKISLEKGIKKLFNRIGYNNNGEVGKYDKILLCQDDSIQHSKKNDIIIKNEAVEVV